MSHTVRLNEGSSPLVYMMPLVGAALGQMRRWPKRFGVPARLAQ